MEKHELGVTGDACQSQSQSQSSAHTGSEPVTSQEKCSPSLTKSPTPIHADSGAGTSLETISPSTSQDPDLQKCLAVAQASQVTVRDTVPPPSAETSSRQDDYELSLRYRELPMPTLPLTTLSTPKRGNMLCSEPQATPGSKRKHQSPEEKGASKYLRRDEIPLENQFGVLGSLGDLDIQHTEDYIEGFFQKEIVTPAREKRRARRNLNANTVETVETETATTKNERKASQDQGVQYFTFSLLIGHFFSTEAIKTLANAFYKHLGETCQVYQPKGPFGPCFRVRDGLVAKAKQFSWANLNVPNLILRIDPYMPHNTSKAERKQIAKKGNSIKNQTQETSRGIIDIQIGHTLNEIKELLNAGKNHILNLKRITNKFGKDTCKVIVTFGTKVAPTEILGSVYKVTVEPVLLTLVRCNRCQRFGHTTKNCKANFIACPHCASAHSHAQCPVKTIPRWYCCANCNGNHGAYSKSCPEFYKYQNIIDQKNIEIKKEWESRKIKANVQTLPRNTQPPPQLSQPSASTPPPPAPSAPQPVNEGALCTKELIKKVLLEILDSSNLKRLSSLNVQEKEQEINKILNIKEKQATQSLSPISNSRGEDMEVETARPDPTPIDAAKKPEVVRIDLTETAEATAEATSEVIPIEPTETPEATVEATAKASATYAQAAAPPAPEVQNTSTPINDKRTQRIHRIRDMITEQTFEDLVKKIHGKGTGTSHKAVSGLKKKKLKNFKSPEYSPIRYGIPTVTSRGASHNSSY